MYLRKWVRAAEVATFALHRVDTCPADACLLMLLARGPLDGLTYPSPVTRVPPSYLRDRRGVRYGPRLRLWICSAT